MALNGIKRQNSFLPSRPPLLPSIHPRVRSPRRVPCLLLWGLRSGQTPRPWRFQLQEGATGRTARSKGQAAHCAIGLASPWPQALVTPVSISVGGQTGTYPQVWRGRQ